MRMWDIHSSESKFTVSAQATNLCNKYENCILKITAVSPLANELDQHLNSVKLKFSPSF